MLKVAFFATTLLVYSAIVHGNEMKTAEQKGGLRNLIRSLTSGDNALPAIQFNNEGQAFSGPLNSGLGLDAHHNIFSDGGFYNAYGSLAGNLLGNAKKLYGNLDVINTEFFKLALSTANNEPAAATNIGS